MQPGMFEAMPPDFPGYADAERQVFQYFDGQQQRCGDPFAIRRRLDACLGNVNKVLRDCHADDAPAKPAGAEGDWPPADWCPAEAAVMHAANARGRLLDAVRVAFEMIPFDPLSGGGALESHCDAAFRAYWEYSEKKSASAGN